MNRRNCLFVLLAAMCVVGFASDVSAQAWPNKPVKIIVPAGAGGVGDLLARIIGEKLTGIWGQQVVVENKPGAGMIVGTDAMAKAAPDGYTFGLVTTPFVANSALIPAQVPYDPVKDFTPISLVAGLPVLITAAKTVPFNNIKELIATAKQKPGTLTVATAGIGGGPHLAAALFQQVTGTEFQVVHYRTGTQATTAVAAGEVQLYFDAPSLALPNAKAGNIKILGISWGERTAVAPDVPTIKEAGVPEFVMSFWQAMVGPAGLPADIKAKVSKDALTVLGMQDVKDRIIAAGMIPLGSSPDELGNHVKSELARWSKVIKDGNIKPE